MTHAAEDVVQSMCDQAGLAGGLHPSRCAHPDDLCRYHQGVEDAFEVMSLTLIANAVPAVGLHEFVDGSDGEMECSVCGGDMFDPAHVDSDLMPFRADH